MISKTLSIGPRGQITLPKKLRDLFKSNSITIQIIDDKHAIISPIQDIGGIISEFHRSTHLSFEEIRDQSWIDSTRKNLVEK